LEEGSCWATSAESDWVISGTNKEEASEIVGLAAVSGNSEIKKNNMELNIQ